MRVQNAELRDFLLDSDLLTGREFEEALREATEKNIPVSDVLVSIGKISEDDVRRIHAHLLGIPFVSLTEREIPYEVISLVPEALVRAHHVVPFARTERGVEVAMLDIEDLPVVGFLREKQGLKILPRLTGADSIKYAHLGYQRALKEKFGDLMSQEIYLLKRIFPDFRLAPEHASVTRVFEVLISHALAQGAPEIYLEPSEGELLVRYRVGGVLREAMSLPREASRVLSSKVRLLAGLSAEETRGGEEGNFQMEAGGEKIYAHAAFLPTIFGEKIVLSLKRPGSPGLSLETLGFEEGALQLIYKALLKPSGLILVAGSKGSGVTTTLYALVDLLNTPEASVATIEERVEYQIPRVSQTQIDASVGLSYARGLRAVLKQEPDVVMVGEMADAEAASLSARAARAGRMVLSGFKADSLEGFFKRLATFKTAETEFYSALSLLIFQKLARRLYTGGQAHTLSKEEIRELSKKANLPKVLSYLKATHLLSESASWETIPLFRPKMFVECESGYKGGVLLYEIWPVTPHLRESISPKASLESIEKQVRVEDCFSMFENGLIKAVRGETSLEEVERVAGEWNGVLSA